MSCTQTANHATRPPYHRPLASPCAQAELRSALFRHLRRTLSLWFARSSQRHDLAALDTHLLKDIGVTPGQAAREAAKPFWME